MMQKPLCVAVRVDRHAFLLDLAQRKSKKAENSEDLTKGLLKTGKKI